MTCENRKISIKWTTSWHAPKRHCLAAPPVVSDIPDIEPGISTSHDSWLSFRHHLLSTPLKDLKATSFRCQVAEKRSFLPMGLQYRSPPRCRDIPLATLLGLVLAATRCLRWHSLEAQRRRQPIPSKHCQQPASSKTCGYFSFC